MELGLKGKTALVTGASKGIGAATASLLAAEGCRLILVARSEAALAALRDQIVAHGGQAEYFPADLSRKECIEALATAFPDTDIVVNNAGAIPAGGLLDVDDARWRAAWDLKVFGYINMCRAYYPRMKQRGGGVIVNVIGAADQIKDPAYLCGVMGNSAITALTLSLGSSSHRDHIRVVGVSPGPVATERLVELDRTMPDAALSRPFGRAASPDEVASAIAYLASPRAAYISGATLLVDAGLSARAQRV